MERQCVRVRPEPPNRLQSRYQPEHLDLCRDAERFWHSRAAQRGRRGGDSAKLLLPTGLTTDSTGNLYIADSGNPKIRKVDTTASHIITTVAGIGLICTNAQEPACGDGDGRQRGVQFSARSILRFAQQHCRYRHGQSARASHRYRRDDHGPRGRWDGRRRRQRERADSWAYRSTWRGQQRKCLRAGVERGKAARAECLRQKI